MEQDKADTQAPKVYLIRERERFWGGRAFWTAFAASTITNLLSVRDYYKDIKQISKEKFRADELQSVGTIRDEAAHAEAFEKGWKEAMKGGIGKNFWKGLADPKVWGKAIWQSAAIFGGAWAVHHLLGQKNKSQYNRPIELTPPPMPSYIANPKHTNNPQATNKHNVSDVHYDYTVDTPNQEISK